MQWNELDYKLQCEVMSRIVRIIKREIDPAIHTGLIAAIEELEMWSNSPCQVLEEENYIASATQIISE